MNDKKSDYPILPIFLQRGSSRAMSGQPVAEELLLTMFEAARWAPSSFNDQPWRFVYVLKEESAWESFFALLDEKNKEWVSGASALIVVLSRTFLEKTGAPSPTHSYDTGAACQNFELQGASMGLCVKAVGGFDYQRALQLVGAPEGYCVEVMFVVGLPAPISVLPERLQHKEKPSSRKPVSEIAFRATFREK